MAKKKTTDPWMVTSILLAVLLFVSILGNIGFGLVAFMSIDGTGTTVQAGTGNQVAAPSPSPAPAPSPSVEVSVDDDAVLGDADAPVTIVEFSDYECPFCGRFYSETFNQIKEQYVDTGQVKIVYRDFPLSFHPRAVPAAMAAECVGELGGDEAYYDMHDLLFENQQSLDDASLQSYAEQVGIDGGDFADCYADEDGAIRAEVNADFADGQAAGVSGTPTVFVNDQKIVGAQPFAAFQAAIEAELSGQQ